MQHRIAGNKLSRNQTLRKATVRDIAKATLICQRICTTKTKAKEARKLVEKLITLGKNGTLADKRRAFSILCDHQLVSDLFQKTSPRFKSRVGGYTRIIPLSTRRRGDNAQLAFLELTEQEEIIATAPKVTTDKKKEKITKEAKPAAEVSPEKKQKKREAKKPSLPKISQSKGQAEPLPLKEEVLPLEEISAVKPEQEIVDAEISKPEEAIKEPPKVSDEPKEKKKGFSLKNLFGRKKPSGE